MRCGGRSPPLRQPLRVHKLLVVHYALGVVAPDTRADFVHCQISAAMGLRVNVIYRPFITQRRQMTIMADSTLKIVKALPALCGPPAWLLGLRWPAHAMPINGNHRPLKASGLYLAQRFQLLPQRFSAANFAISRLRSGLKALARAVPPFSPPSLPSATACGFLPSTGVTGTGSATSASQCPWAYGIDLCWPSHRTLIWFEATPSTVPRLRCGWPTRLTRSPILIACSIEAIKATWLLFFKLTIYLAIFDCFVDIDLLWVSSPPSPKPR